MPPVWRALDNKKAPEPLPHKVFPLASQHPFENTPTRGGGTVEQVVASHESLAAAVAPALPSALGLSPFGARAERRYNEKPEPPSGEVVRSRVVPRDESLLHQIATPTLARFQLDDRFLAW